MFTPDQLAALDLPLDPKDIKSRKGAWDRESQQRVKLAYIDGRTSIAHANAIFGYGCWGVEILDLKISDPADVSTGESHLWRITAIATLRLTVRAGENTCRYEDVGSGTTTSHTAEQLDPGDAAKSAITDGVKRCLRYFGPQFGLDLYDKQETQPAPQKAPRVPQQPSGPVAEAAPAPWHAGDVKKAKAWFDGQMQPAKIIDGMRRMNERFMGGICSAGQYAEIEAHACLALSKLLGLLQPNEADAQALITAARNHGLSTSFQKYLSQTLGIE